MCVWIRTGLSCSYVTLCMFSGQSKYCKITNVSIIVLGIYTCGTSVLFWWLYKLMYGLCNGKEKDSFQGMHVHMYIYIIYTLSSLLFYLYMYV